MRCRVRHFSDGVVLGSKEFVNSFYERLKSTAQSDPSYDGQYEKRESGARELTVMCGEDDETLFSMRDLKKDALN